MVDRKMKKGDTVYGVNQPGMTKQPGRKHIVKGILVAGNLVIGYSEEHPDGALCYTVNVSRPGEPPAIYDNRLFSITDVFATEYEAERRYFQKTLEGE